MTREYESVNKRGTAVHKGMPNETRLFTSTKEVDASPSNKNRFKLSLKTLFKLGRHWTGSTSLKLESNHSGHIFLEQ